MRELSNVDENEQGRMFLTNASFCKAALCPMCTWRKSLKLYYQVGKVMDIAQVQYPNVVPLFLTLTIQNCVGDSLKSTLDAFYKGWYALMRNRKIKRISRGWFRALEITIDKDKVITMRRYYRAKKYYDKLGLKPGDANPNFGKFHPHFHVILLGRV